MEYSDKDKIFKYFFDKIFEQKKKKLTFFIHNLTFDGALLLEWVTSIDNHNKIKYETIIKNNNLYFIKIKWNNYTINFKCSYKILPLSLKNISIGFNIKENKLPYPYKGINKNVIISKNYEEKEEDFNSIDDYELYKSLNIKCFKEYTIKYCLNDVIITENFLKIIKNLCKKQKINIESSKIYSAPGLSLKIFLKNFNTKKINLNYNKLFDSYIRQAYYGGRCEVFGNYIENEGKIFHFDFSGMYSWCLTQKFPIGKYKFTNSNLDINTPGYYYILYTSNNMEIPILPHHNEKNKKLMFTNGENSGIFWFEEIQLFLKYGGIINEVKSGIIFERYEECFKDFVSHFEEIKKLGGSYKIFGKLIINSLYGKLGNKKYNESSFIESYNDYIKRIKMGKEITSVSQINEMFLVTEKSNKKIKNQKFGIQFAAAITSKARIRLYENMMEIIKNGGKMLYTDTDSYFIQHKENIIGRKDKEVLWEDDSIEKAVFIAPKIYGLKLKNKEKIKIKGITSSNISYNELEKKFYNNDSELIINQLSLQKKNLKIKFITQNKKINIESYDKRKFDKEKKNTKPFTLINKIYT